MVRHNKNSKMSTNNSVPVAAKTTYVPKIGSAVQNVSKKYDPKLVAKVAKTLEVAARPKKLTRTKADKLAKEMEEPDEILEIEVKGIPVKTDFYLSETDLALLKVNMPGYLFYPGNSPHSHPKLAIERKLAEEEVYKLLNVGEEVQLVDIGGNPIRHNHRPNVHSCCPNMSPSDSYRESARQVYKAMNPMETLDYCTDLVQECKTIAHAYMAIQSIYYLEDSEIVELVYKSLMRKMVVAVHEFPGDSGKFYDEAMWNKADGLVHMCVNGNNIEYVHRELPFLQTGYLQYLNKAVSVTLYRRIGFTSIYVLVPTPLVPKQKLQKRIFDPYGYFQIDVEQQLKPDVKKTTGEVFETPTMYSMGDKFCYRYGSTIVMIPKGFVSQLRLYMVNKPRTPEKKADLTRYAKTIHSRFNIPDHNLALVVETAINIAYLDVSTGINSLLEQSSVQSKFDYYNALLDGTRCPIDIFKYLKRLLSLSQWVITAVGLGYLIKKIFQLLHLRPFRLNIFYYIIKLLRRLLNYFQVVPSNQRETVCLVDQELKDAEPFAPFPKEPCVATFGNVLVAFGLKWVKPVVARTCIHNEYVSVNNRVLFDREDYYLHDEHKRPLQQSYQNLFTSDGTLIPSTDWDVWVNHFPPARRANLNKAHNDEYSLPKNVCSLFVKRENQIKSVCFEYNDSTHLGYHNASVELFDPRAIFKQDDRYQTIVGPFVDAYQDYFSIRNGAQNINHPFSKANLAGHYYAAHIDLEKLGTTFTTMITLIAGTTPDFTELMLPKVLFVEGDASRYDAYQDHFIKCFEREAILSYCSDPFVKKTMRATHYLEGVTQHGLRFNTANGRGTGESNTTTGNTQLMMALFDYCYKHLQLHGIDLDLGDDSLAVFPVADIDNIREMDAVFHDCGFKMKFKMTQQWLDVEFCSKRPYLTTDGLVFGPKLGRYLAKTFYCTHNFKPLKLKAWAYQVAYGLRFDVSYVPIARVLNELVLKRFWGANLAYLHKDLLTEHPSHRATKPHQLHPLYIPMLESFLGVKTGTIDRLEKHYSCTFPKFPVDLEDECFRKIVAWDCEISPFNEPLPGRVNPFLPRSLTIPVLEYSTIISPFFEEVVTHHFTVPWRICFSACESILARDSLVVAAVRLVLHTVLRLMPLWLAIPTHLFINVFGMSSA